MESEAEAERSYSISRRRSSRLGSSVCVKETKKKRKPLSDLTNFVNPNSKPSIRKPYSPTSIFLNPPLNSPISDSSIGSSNFNTNTCKDTPQSYKFIPGKGKDVGRPLSSQFQEKKEIDGRTFSPDSVALSFPSVEKTKDRGKATIALHLEKTKDRGKATIALHLEKTKDKGKATIVPHVEKTKDKGKATDVALKVYTGEKPRDKANAITGYVSNHDVLKIQSKGKNIALPSDRISLESVKDERKESNATVGLPSIAKTKDKGKIVVTPEDFPTAEKRKEKGKGVLFPYSCPPLPKTRYIGNGLNVSGDNGPSEFHTDVHMKHKKKRRCFPPDQDTPEYNLPADFIEKQRAYFKEVDEFELLEEEVCDDEK